MSRLDSLPPDLHAALALVLRQHKRHGEVAALLGIEQRAVHDRTHAALALLAPLQARALSTAEREQLGEYLLGQQTAAQERETRAQLEASPAARTWAQALAGELAPLAAQPLPDIPTGREAPAAASPDIPTGREAPAAAPPAIPTGREAPAAAPPAIPTGQAAYRPPPEVPGGPPTYAQIPAEPRASAQPPSAPSSRTGGAIVLGVIAVLVIVAVLLIVGVGGGGSHSGASATGAGQSTGSATQTSSGTSTGTATSAGTSTGGGTSTGTASTGSQATHGKALALTPPDPATSKAAGIAYVLTQKGQRAFYVFTKGLPTTTGGAFYAVWLEGAPSAPAYPLGSLPPPNASGLVEGGGPLPADAGNYTRIVVTRETSHHPAHPGPTALGGAFTLE